MRIGFITGDETGAVVMLLLQSPSACSKLVGVSELHSSHVQHQCWPLLWFHQTKKQKATLCPLGLTGTSHSLIFRSVHENKYSISAEENVWLCSSLDPLQLP